MTGIKPGLYRHYRGPKYWVRGEAINTTNDANDANDERMVVYVKEDDKDDADAVPFVRRKTEFLEVIPWPDGYPRPRWTSEEVFTPRERPRAYWIGSLDYALEMLGVYLTALLEERPPEVNRAPVWMTAAYLNDVLAPVLPRPLNPDAYCPMPSGTILAPVFGGDREAMRAEVQRRLGDLLYIENHQPELADLPALKAFAEEKLLPLAKAEKRKGRGCF
jgi:hypothetical protein